MNGLTVSLVQAMAQKVVVSIEQLQAILGVGVPRNRVAQLNELLERSQSYLVFLEEIAGSQKERSRQEAVDMFKNIYEHCLYVDRAWSALVPAA